MATFEELFAGRNVTAMVQGVKPGLPLRVPASLLTPTDRVPGHVFEWFEVDGNREMAEIVGQDSPAKRVGHQGAKRKTATMLRSFESQQHTANKLRNILNADGTVRDEMGRQYVTRQAQWFRRRMVNLQQTSVQRMLFSFELHFDEHGRMLTSSSNAVTSIVVGVPDGQKDQLDILGDGDIIGDSWATSTTDILGHLNEIIDAMLQLSGWEITEAYHGKNIAGYIAANDDASEYIKRTPDLASQRMQNGRAVPNGFQNLNWHDASNAFYIDADGAVQKLVGEDEIVFTPSPADDTWWKHAVGSEMVPSGLGQVTADAVAQLGSLIEVMGEFSYATMSANPVSIEQFAGLNFLPVIAATKAVCKADVTP